MSSSFLPLSNGFQECVKSFQSKPHHQLNFVFILRGACVPCAHAKKSVTLTHHSILVGHIVEVQSATKNQKNVSYAEYVESCYYKLCMVCANPEEQNNDITLCRYAPPHPKAIWPLSANILDPVRASVVCSGPSQIIQVHISVFSASRFTTQSLKTNAHRSQLMLSAWVLLQLQVN